MFGKRASNIANINIEDHINLEQNKEIVKGSMSIDDESIIPNYNAAIGNIISREKNGMRNAKNMSHLS
jgi:hypothetical protein